MHANSQGVSASFTRPADTTAYTSGDLVANSTTAGSVTPLTFNSAHGFGAVMRARIEKSNKTTTNAAFDLHLFESSPAVVNGDNGAFSIADLSGYLGKVSVTVNALAGATTGANGSADASAICPSGAVMYGLLAATAAYTPASAEVFTVTLLHRD